VWSHPVVTVPRISDEVLLSWIADDEPAGPSAPTVTSDRVAALTPATADAADVESEPSSSGQYAAGE
jgi:hypothetical protein